MGLLMLGLVLIGLWFAALIAYPRLGWRFRRWEFRNPDAIEPSNLSLALIRTGGVVGVVVAVTGMVFLARLHNPADTSTRAEPAPWDTMSSAPPQNTETQVNTLVDEVRSASAQGDGDPRLLLVRLGENMNLSVTNLPGHGNGFDVTPDTEQPEGSDTWCVQVPTGAGSWTFAKGACAPAGK